MSKLANTFARKLTAVSHADLRQVEGGEEDPFAGIPIPPVASDSLKACVSAWEWLVSRDDAISICDGQ
jgi:hypothetical protein